MTDLYVGLDIRATKLMAGVATPGGEVLGEATTPTPQRLRPQEVLDSLLDLANLAIRKAGAIWREVKGVGMSFGGPVDYVRGSTVACYHLPGWSNVPLVKVVRSRLQLPVVLDNNANLAALSEARFGAGRGCDDLLYVSVSSGIGSGLILGGRVFRGSSGLAGEIGHTILRPGGPKCTCGKHGCLEALASGWAITRDLKAATGGRSKAARPGGASVRATTLAVDAQAIAAAACAEDGPTVAVLGEAADALGQGIAAALNILNLPLVVIGGDLVEAGEALLAPLRRAVSAYAVREVAESARIAPSELRHRASLLGAVALMVDTLCDSSESAS